MLSFTKQQKGEAFDRLPKETKQVVMGSFLGLAIDKVLSKNKLLDENKNILHEIVIAVMLGLLEKERAQDTIQNELKLTPEQAGAVNKMVLEDILSKISDLVKREEEESYVSLVEDVEEKTENLKVEQRGVGESEKPPITPKTPEKTNDRESILRDIEDVDTTTNQTPSSQEGVQKKPNKTLVNVPVNLPTGVGPDRNQIVGRLTNNLKPPTITIPEKNPSTSSGQVPSTDLRPSENLTNQSPQINTVNRPLVQQKPPQQTNVPRYGNTDPYRESLE